MKRYEDWPVPVGAVVVNGDGVTLVHAATPDGFDRRGPARDPRPARGAAGRGRRGPPPPHAGAAAVAGRRRDGAVAAPPAGGGPGARLRGGGGGVWDGGRTLLRPDLCLSRPGAGTTPR